MERLFSLFAGKIAWASGRPGAFVLAVLVVLGWAATGPMFAFSETWQLVINTGTTIVTFLMVFLIQNSQNRDIIAVQSKLDELIRVQSKARNELVGIEKLTDIEIEEYRDKLEEETRILADKKTKDPLKDAAKTVIVTKADVKRPVAKAKSGKPVSPKVERAQRPSAKAAGAKPAGAPRKPRARSSG